ncbi:MAG: adenylosuccinate synthase [Deltaproteobacteria bacterium]|nr:adenylosuccinate synthase [Deltaproteobacteria bacterium]
MPNVVITGTQWGDEGKGKIVDSLTSSADVIVRFQGGANAGHTLVVNGRRFVLHLIPSGVCHAGKVCVVGGGVVIDPLELVTEIDQVKGFGYLVNDAELIVSEQAHVILPYHKTIDAARERGLGGKKIGTTGRGIGPCYEDKVARRGIRMCDLVDPDALRARLEDVLPEKNLYLERVLGEKPVDLDAIVEQVREPAQRIKPYVANASRYLAEARRQGKSILFEGAQGSLLDVDHGTYPFVTSSNTVAGNACVGSGIGPTAIDEVIGICKAYTTRVGAGPFPTELEDSVGEALRSRGDEFGATTGRARRCGWFDAVVARHAMRTNGLTGLIITKLDVLSGLDPLKICVGYRIDGNDHVDTVPPTRLLERAEPVYETVPGWTESLSGLNRLDQLPGAARHYLDRLAELVGTEIVMLSLGPKREELIEIRNPFRR